MDFILSELLASKTQENVVINPSYDLVVMLCVGFQIKNHVAYHFCSTEELLCS